MMCGQKTNISVKGSGSPSQGHGSPNSQTHPGAPTPEITGPADTQSQAASHSDHVQQYPEVPAHQEHGDARTPLELQHAFNIVQHLASHSLRRWGRNTWKRVAREVTIDTSGGRAPPGSYSKAEVIAWWKHSMLELVNNAFRELGQEPMDEDSYAYDVEDSDHVQQYPAVPAHQEHGDTRTPLELKHAFNIVQHIASHTLKRWNPNTWKKVAREVTIDTSGASTRWNSNTWTKVAREVTIDTSGASPGSYSKAEAIAWWKHLILELVNNKLRELGQEPMDEDRYAYDVEDSNDAE